VARQEPNLRLLYVTANAQEAKMAEAALRPHGYAVDRVGAASEGAEALHRAGYDAMIVSHPLPDADVIGACATFGQVPAAPPTIVLDAFDRKEEIAHTVPVAMHPARVLCAPIDLAKLPELLAELLDRADDAAFVAPPVYDRLARTLGELCRRKETGALELHSEGVCTRIYFLDGQPVSTEGGPLRETLGRMLLRRGALSEDDYVRVIDRMTESIMANEHQRMGEVLVQLGLMTSSEVYAALSHQVIEKITNCFALRDFEPSFDEMNELPEGLEAFPIPPVPALVLEGLSEHADPTDLDRLLRTAAREGARFVQIRGDARETGRRFALESPELRLVAQIDGTRTAAALLDAGMKPALLAALLWTGAATLEAPPTPEAPQATAPPRRRPEFAREVVLPRKRKLTPTPRSESPSAEDELEPQAENPQSRLEAEQFFRRAQSLLEAERIADALSMIRRVVALQPLEPEYRMVEAWVNYQHARVEMRVARAKAGACARKAADADPNTAKPHAILGNLALEDRDHDRARREFEAALVRDPENVDALRGLKRVRGNREGAD
jgi:CheY-like chemotaxis protein